MKRIFKVLLTVMLLVSTFSYALIHNCEHVHAINAGDMIRLECPNCHHVTYCMATSDCFPDCTNSATCVVVCQECGLDFIATIPALGHDFSIVVSNTKATCTKDGFQMLECSRCGTTQGVPIPALGHKYKSKVTLISRCIRIAESNRIIRYLYFHIRRNAI